MSKAQQLKPRSKLAKRSIVQKSMSKQQDNKHAAIWQEFIGMFKDDPDFAEVKRIMADKRKEADADDVL